MNDPSHQDYVPSVFEPGESSTCKVDFNIF